MGLIQVIMYIPGGLKIYQDRRKLDEPYIAISPLHPIAFSNPQDIHKHFRPLGLFRYISVGDGIIHSR